MPSLRCDLSETLAHDLASAEVVEALIQAADEAESRSVRAEAEQSLSEQRESVAAAADFRCRSTGASNAAVRPFANS